MNKQCAAAVLSTLLATTAVAAGEQNPRSSEEEAATQLARERMAKAMVALDKQMKACDARQATLTKDDLEGLDVPREQLLAGLVYFHVRNENACVEDEAKDFLLATYLLDEAGVLEEMGETTQSEMASFVMHSYWQEVEHEARYRALPEEVREDLEAIEALQTPFKLIESSEALGLL